MSHKSGCAVILTALPVEYNSVKAHLTDLQEIVHPRGTVYEEGKFACTNGSWQVVIVETGAGNVKVAAETERAIQHFKPSILFFVGVAGGVKDVAIGDVVVATKVYGYESGKAKLKFKTRPELGSSAYSMVQRAQAEAKKNDWLHRIKTPLPTRVPRVFVGPIAAGEKVIASTRSSVFKFLRSNYGDTLAVEMEGYGFLKATYINQQVEPLVIRGISDLIDSKSASDATGSQKTAAENASAFAFEVLANLLLQSKPSAGKSGQQPRRKMIYELNLPEDEQQVRIALYGWNFLQFPDPYPITVSQGILSLGTVNTTTFNRAPVAEMANCSVECKLRIDPDPAAPSGAPALWAGIRVRGFLDDIQFGYLVYLRRAGTVELYRARKVIGGANIQVAHDVNNKWTHLRVDIIDSRIRVWVNNKPHVETTDRMFGNTGHIYLHTFGTHAHFTDFRVYEFGR